MGGKFHLKLNTGSRPIANKYHEGKMKKTLKRELKVLEIAELEANGTSPLVEIAAGGNKVYFCFFNLYFRMLAPNVLLERGRVGHELLADDTVLS